jgi:hypothetical protein
VVYTQAQLETKIAVLESALASGALRVDFGDRSTTYRSVAELKDSLSYFQRLLEGADGSTRRKQTYAVTGKGLCT